MGCGQKGLNSVAEPPDIRNYVNFIMINLTVNVGDFVVKTNVPEIGIIVAA